MRIETNVAQIPSNFTRVFPGALPLMEIDTNDRVAFVQEGNGAGPGGVDTHRYQVLYFTAPDATQMAFWTDLGPADDFRIVVDDTTYPAPPYQQLVLNEHSAAECMHIAEQCRMDDFAIQLLHTQTNESTLFEDYLRMVELDMELVKNRSVFGPHVRAERNGYSRTYIDERIRQETAHG